MEQQATKPKTGRQYYRLIVWVLRVAVGGVFMFSGFAKCIDPWGFIYKIEEYLQVWGVEWMWREAVLCLAVTISTVEFCTGFAVLTGCLRRTSAIVLALFMAVMLPLTAYIAIANPVSDCGCFGDALVISNTATFAKNVVLAAAAVYLLRYNSRVGGLYPPLSQVLPMLLSVAYCLLISFLGITVQPLIDFREYKVGTQLVDDAAAELRLVYERDGVRKAYTIDSLPDSTWTYVGRETGGDTGHNAFAVFDADDEVTDQVIETDGPQVLLVVPDINHYGKTRASMANNINDYVSSRGGSMIGVVAASGATLERWKDAAKPHFEIYSSDDTTLKELVRGDAGVVYLRDGRIVWKRSIYSLGGDFPDFSAADDQLEAIKPIDNGERIRSYTLIYGVSVVGLLLLCLIRIKKSNKTAEKKN